MSYLELAKRIAADLTHGEAREPRDLGTGFLLEARYDWIAVRLHSRLLQLEIWLARDMDTAETLWTETRLPVFLLSEVPRFRSTPLELLRAIAKTRAVFGPSGSRWAS